MLRRERVDGHSDGCIGALGNVGDEVPVRLAYLEHPGAAVDVQDARGGLRLCGFGNDIVYSMVGGSGVRCDGDAGVEAFGWFVGVGEAALFDAAVEVLG